MAAADRFRPEPGSGAGPEEIQRDIDRTRREAAETLGALANKLDVKQRVRHKLADSRQSLAHRSHDAKELSAHLFNENTAVAVAGIAAFAALAGLLVWTRRR